MITHELTQGSPEWLAYRAQHFNASDAPAMMSCSPYKTRSQLLREMHTGISEEVDAAAQRRFDEGHRIEALARPLAEAIIGEEVYPVTGSKGRYSASFDGLTMAEHIGFEHKTLNDDLRAVMVPGASGADLPMVYRVQMEQQMMVSGAERILFMASKWSGDDLVEERHCWYEGDAELAGHIVLGWEQFEKDLLAYTPPPATTGKPVGKTMESLPALHVELKGEVTASNLAEFKDYAVAMIKSINRELTTDQHFADAAKAVKWCGDVKDRMTAVKEHALAQTQSIDTLFRTIDSIIDTADEVRKELDKLVKTRNTEIKDSMVLKARQSYSDHVAGIEVELQPLRLAALSAPNFADAIKGKRSFTLMQDAIDSALAAGKIAADAMGKDYRAKQAWFATAAEGYRNLFADLQTLVLKPMEDFQMFVTGRVDAQKRTEKERDDRVAAAAVATAQPAIEAPTPAVVPLSVVRTAQATRPIAPSTPPTLKLGQISERLGFNLTADFLKGLGFEPAARDKSAQLFHEASFTHICAALVDHIGKVQAKQAA